MLFSPLLLLLPLRADLIRRFFRAIDIDLRHFFFRRFLSLIAAITPPLTPLSSPFFAAIIRHVYYTISRDAHVSCFMPYRAVSPFSMMPPFSPLPLMLPLYLYFSPLTF